MNQPANIAPKKDPTLRNWLIIIAVALIIWFMPNPEGLSIAGQHLFALFVATILGFVLAPIPMGPMALLSLSLCALLKVASLGDLLSGFANTTVWLVVMAFFLARGFLKTGLARRISLLIVKAIGTNTLRLGYSMAFSDLFFGPVMPSVTARGGAIVFPIINGLCEVFDSKPGATARKVGAYLFQVEHHATCIVSAMFITAMASNPLAVGLAAKTVGVEITWMGWFVAAVVPGVISILLMPLILYKIYPPELKETPEAPQMAREELTKMGPISGGEKTMLGVFVGCLALWTTGTLTGISATTVALLAAAFLLVTSVITWKDCLGESGAWDLAVWLAVLISLAGLMTKLGVVKWIAESVGGMLTGIAWLPTLVIMVLFYLYVHYLFASLTAHISAFYAPLLAIAVFAGAPAMLAAIVLGFFGNLCGSLTHYSSGPAPIFFGAGYVDQGTWWKLGFIIATINMVIWLGAGSVWWKVLGLY
ncbi:MAG: DASS family sodium-coupled anion symporter [Syntrophomonas sp.]|nr:DASS family sodium-coupled anion symporter [Syntrophomonas sp.]